MADFVHIKLSLFQCANLSFVRLKLECSFMGKWRFSIFWKDPGFTSSLRRLCVHLWGYQREQKGEVWSTGLISDTTFPAFLACCFKNSPCPILGLFYILFGYMHLWLLTNHMKKLELYQRAAISTLISTPKPHTQNLGMSVLGIMLHSLCEPSPNVPVHSDLSICLDFPESV